MFLTLIKLKLAVLFEDLGDRFNASVKLQLLEFLHVGLDCLYALSQSFMCLMLNISVVLYLHNFIHFQS